MNARTLLQLARRLLAPSLESDAGRSVRRYWEARARAYGRRAVLNLGHPPEQFDAVTRRQKSILFPLLKQTLKGDERLILDYGCGPGRFTGDLARLISGKAIGVDPIPGFLRMAPRAENTEFLLLDGSTIPLPRDSVDAVWVCLVLGGLDDAGVEVATAELGRVLKPGGVIFLVENTSNLPDQPSWRFRSVQRYRAVFACADLEHLDDYVDLGERISVLRGYKKTV